MNLGILHGEAIPAELSPTPHIPYIFVDIIQDADSGLVVRTDLALKHGAPLTLCTYDTQERNWHLFHVHAGTSISESHGILLSLKPDPFGGKGKPLVLEFLMRCPLLEAISHESFLAFVNCLKKREYAAGDVLVTQNDEQPWLFMIQSGVCDAGVESEGRIYHAAELKSGDLAGEMPILTGGPADMQVTARTDVVAWAMSRDDFDMLSQNNPDLRVFLTEMLTRRIETCQVEAERYIGKYRICRKLGAGGWGMVYYGEHVLLRMPVAVKMLKHTMSLEPCFSDTFRREAEIIASLAHENIVRVYDVEEAYRTLFIIMEYLEGESLQDLLQRLGKLEPKRAENILAQVLLGLGHAHEKGIVHRDVKPDNIFLLPGDRVKILDFGLACPPGTEDMSLAGTIFYASPEQVEGAPVDARSDIYGTGIMAYEMLCGKRPYPEDDLAMLVDLRCEKEVPDPCLECPELPEHLRDFILGCCALDPGERFESASSAFETLTADRPLETPPARRVLRAIFLSHDQPSSADIDALLEEFFQRARDKGATLKLVDIHDEWP